MQGNLGCRENAIEPYSRFLAAFPALTTTPTGSPNAPRFYTARLSFNANSFSGLTFQSVVSFKQPDGTDYPKVPDLKVADRWSVQT